MVLVSFKSTEDKWLLSLALGLKQVDCAGSKQTGQIGLRFADGQVRGAAACLLTLEAAEASPSLFPNGNIGMPIALMHWRASMVATPLSATSVSLANAELIGRQMHDGRLFLQGNQPGLADIASASWLLPRQDLLPAGHSLHAWLERMASIGNSGGNRRLSTIETNNLRDMEQQGLLQTSRNAEGRLVTSPLDI